MFRVADMGRGAVLAAFLLLAAGPAGAVSETYVFTAGTATITVDDDTGPIGGPLTVALNGIQVTVDEAQLQLVSMQLSTQGDWILSVDPARSGGFDTITIHQATLLAQNGSLNFVVAAGDARAYSYTIGPVAVISDFTASVGGNPGIEFAGFPASDPEVTGPLVVQGSGIGALLELNGITIAEVQSPLSANTVRVKADFRFQGVNPIPEAHAALLFGIGAIIVGYATRSRLARH